MKLNSSGECSLRSKSKDVEARFPTDFLTDLSARGSWPLLAIRKNSGLNHLTQWQNIAHTYSQVSVARRGGGGVDI